MATTNSDTKVITGEVRLSYAHLFKPFSNNPDQEAQYSCVLLIPKKDKKTLAAIRAAQQAALEQGKSSKFGGTIPKNWQNTLKDGDEDADLERNPEYENHWYMSVKSKTAPGVVDRRLQEIIDSTEVYSGCYAKVSINAFPYSVSGNKGVSFGLNHVQKLRDGDFLGGRSKAEDDFDDEGDDEDDYDDPDSVL
jgi:hypothetical protein